MHVNDAYNIIEQGQQLASKYVATIVSVADIMIYHIYITYTYVQYIQVQGTNTSTRKSAQDTRHKTQDTLPSPSPRLQYL